MCDISNAVEHFKCITFLPLCDIFNIVRHFECPVTNSNVLWHFKCAMAFQMCYDTSKVPWHFKCAMSFQMWQDITRVQIQPQIYELWSSRGCNWWMKCEKYDIILASRNQLRGRPAFAFARISAISARPDTSLLHRRFGLVGVGA